MTNISDIAIDYSGSEQIFLTFDMLDAMIASALEEASQHAINFPKKSKLSKSNVLKNTTGSCEEDKLRA